MIPRWVSFRYLESIHGKDTCTVTKGAYLFRYIRTEGEQYR